MRTPAGLRYLGCAAALLLGLLASACDEGDSNQVSGLLLASGPATLSLELENIRYEQGPEGRHRYVHDRRFQETAGVGVTLERGKVCVENGKVCVDALVNYRIDGAGTLVQPGHHVATKLDEDRITMDYWGVDDGGNAVRLQKVLLVHGRNATVEK